MLTGLLLSTLVAASDPYGLESRQTLSQVNIPFEPASDDPVLVRKAFPSLKFSFPLYAAFAPGQGQRYFVVERCGTIKTFLPSPTVASASVFLSISSQVLCSGEQGLLGLTFDAGYIDNGYFYVNYVADNPRRTVISRFTANADRISADPSSEVVLLTYEQPADNHKGGTILFGSDGKLYISSGDGGFGNDPGNRAQNLGEVLGKILRINPTPGDIIPADNPFASTPGARGEIWSYGMRNPFRMAFDPWTGDLFAGDVGQGCAEEIDRILPGRNYGWPVWEGDRDNPAKPNQAYSLFEPPVLTYYHARSGPNNCNPGLIGDGESVTGGAFYHGAALPELAGSYLYADFVSGKLWALRHSAGTLQSNVQIGEVNLPAAIVGRPDGELVVVSFDGYLYELLPNNGTGQPMPSLLSQTGLFTNLANLTPTPGLIDYSVNAPFWSDGAQKRRWFGLYGRTKFNFNEGYLNWGVPNRALAVKHFEMPAPGGGTKRLETRVLVKQSTGFNGYVYRWNEDGSDATLLRYGQGTYLTVPDSSQPGGTRQQFYEFPSRAMCKSCHNPAAGNFLGIGNVQMNRTHDFNGVIDNQLRAYNHIQLFNIDIGEAAAQPALADPSSVPAGLKARARAYLHANCSSCHRPSGGTPSDMDLRANKSMSATNTVNVTPSFGDLGIADARIIVPGDKERSVLWQRMRKLDGDRMPQIASHALDREGIALIGNWINSGAK